MLCVHACFFKSSFEVDATPANKRSKFGGLLDSSSLTAELVQLGAHGGKNGGVRVSLATCFCYYRNIIILQAVVMSGKHVARGTLMPPFFCYYRNIIILQAVVNCLFFAISPLLNPVVEMQCAIAVLHICICSSPPAYGDVNNCLYLAYGNVPNPTPGPLKITPLVNTGQPTLYSLNE